MDLRGVVTQDQADRLSRHQRQIVLTVRKAAWTQPVYGSHFTYRGEAWMIDSDPVDAGEGWTITAHPATEEPDYSHPLASCPEMLA